MIQNIDLYPDYLRPKPIILPLNQWLLITAIVSLLLCFLMVYLVFKKDSLEVRVKQLTDELSTIETNIEEFKQTNEKKELDVFLKSKETLLHTMLDKRNKLLDYLAESNFGYSGGYSKFFVALAKQHVEELWLTRIYFKEEAAEARIIGRAASSKLIPEYITKLQRESAFDQVVFTGFSLQQSNEFKNLIEFELSIIETPVIESTTEIQAAWIH